MKEIPVGTENLTEDEKRSLAYLNYPGCPQIYNAENALDNGSIKFGDDGSVEVQDIESGEVVKIQRAYQYDIIPATIFGLNENIVKAERGVELRNILDKEIKRIESGSSIRYGEYVYYPTLKMLAHFTSQEFLRLSLVASTSSLLQDPNLEKDWNEIDSILRSTVVGCAGCSVGNAIGHSSAMDCRFIQFKCGDPNMFKMTNFNRVRGSFWDIVWSKEQSEVQPNIWGLRNKAVALAHQIHTIDPFMDIWTYSEGVNQENIKSFINGNRVEPKVHYIIEETDDPNTKVFIREKCREAGVRVIMASDAGSAVQIDIRPFDTNPDATLAYGISDEELYERQRQANARPKDRVAFFQFADGLLGSEYRRDEFKAIINGELKRVFASIPQLGSTAAFASGQVSEVVTRTRLGYKFPERFIIDKKRLEILMWGEEV